MGRPSSPRDTTRMTLTVDTEFKALLDEFALTTGLSSASFLTSYIRSSESILKSVINTINNGKFEDKQGISQLLGILLPIVLESEDAQALLDIFNKHKKVQRIVRTTRDVK